MNGFKIDDRVAIGMLPDYCEWELGERICRLAGYAERDRALLEKNHLNRYNEDDSERKYSLHFKVLQEELRAGKRTALDYIMHLSQYSVKSFDDEYSRC